MSKLILTDKDLAEIHSLSVKGCIDLPVQSEYNKDVTLLMAYSWTDAVVRYLNSKKVLDIEIELDRKISKRNWEE